MRTLLIIMSVLAITAVAYGFDVDQSRKWNKNFIKCNEDLGGSPSEPCKDTVKCAAEKDGKLLNANGEYIKAETLQRIEDVISDPNEVKISQALFNLCYDEAVGSGICGNEQTEKIATCIVPLIRIIDQLK